MSKPIIRNIQSFPATEQRLLLFDVVGSGNQVVYNELEIRKNNTNELVYLDRKQEFRYQRTIGEGYNPVLLNSNDYIHYDIPSNINLLESYQIYKDDTQLNTGFVIDDTNRQIIFDTVLKENINEPLEHVSGYKNFRFSNHAEESLDFKVTIDGIEIGSEEFKIDFENNRILFNSSLSQFLREVMTYDSVKRCYKYSYNIDTIDEEKIFINNNQIKEGYSIDHINKEVYLYQTVNKEVAVASNQFTTYTVTRPILNNSEIEVYIDNQLVEQGYTIDYATRRINFFFSPYPLNNKSRVEVTYKTSFVPTGTIEIEYEYFNKVITAKYTKLIPEISIAQNYLENGKQYYAIIRTYDMQQNLLGQSDPAFFYCFSKPILTIPQIINGQVNSQTITFNGDYFQNEDEQLQSYIYKLYDSNKILLTQSDEIFGNDLIYEFSNLENKKTYYVELNIITIHGLDYSTGLLAFTPIYIAPRFASAIQLENNFREASVSIECNVLRIIGKPFDPNVVYIDDGLIDLRNNIIDFTEGFSLNGDFTLQIYVKDIVNENVFLEILSKYGTSIALKKDSDKIIFIKKQKDGFVLQYFYNELSQPLEDNTLFISIHRVNGSYDMYTEVLEVV